MYVHVRARLCDACDESSLFACGWSSAADIVLLYTDGYYIDGYHGRMYFCLLLTIHRYGIAESLTSLTSSVTAADIPSLSLSPWHDVHIMSPGNSLVCAWRHDVAHALHSNRSDWIVTLATQSFAPCLPSSARFVRRCSSARVFCVLLFASARPACCTIIQFAQSRDSSAAGRRIVELGCSVNLNWIWNSPAN